MERFTRIGVFLNQEPGDDEAIRFAGLIAAAAQAESLNFVVVRGLEAPPVTSVDINSVREQVLSNLPLAGDQHIEVAGATGLHEILRAARELDLDLIVVGRRLPSDQLGKGSVFYRLARKAPCSVLVTPEHAHAHLNRLLVMVDFSEHSRMALETAVVIARACGAANPQVVVQATSSVGYGYKYSGLSLEQAVEERRRLTHKELDEFMDGLSTGEVDVERVVSISESPENAALDLASARNMDAVVLGSRGMSSPAAALLGATSDRILSKAPLPVLIVKHKGETIPFLKALLSGDHVSDHVAVPGP